MFWYWDALFSRTTENSIYRKKAIASLNLTGNSVILDVACGTGLNFKIIESYLRNGGRLVGVDFSPETLKVARNQIAKHKWTNIELVNMRITDYEPAILFDASLCTFALETMPDYKIAVNKIFHLLKPQGKFAMIGVKVSSRMPYKLGNAFMEWFSRKFGGIDVHRDVSAYVKSKCSKTNYEECFGGFYYILSTSKSCFTQ
jgi:ubiquinone/menaquinone biosynthesis C-methylase UbiE